MLSGQYGRLTAYDATDQVLTSVDMQMRNVADCGQESITFGAYGTVSGTSSPIRRVRIEPPQPWHWDVFLAGEFCCVGYVTANYLMVLSSAAPAPTITIVSAGGPNPGGSFIVKAPENVIKLEARVTPASLASSVEWEIVPVTTFTIPPGSVPRGASTTFVVPNANINPGPGNYVPGPGANPGRWPPSHPGALSAKSFAYRITAKVTAAGQTVRSQPVTVQQDEIDVLREEYVEFGQESVPPRSEVGRSGDGNRNVTGDYTVWLSGPRLLERMPIMQALARRRWDDREIGVMSGFRNPVHHIVHQHLRHPNSSHLFGLAVDWIISDANRRPPGMSAYEWWKEIHTMTRHPSVDGCWEPEAVLRAGENGALTHGHTDWRDITFCRRIGWL